MAPTRELKQILAELSEALEAEPSVSSDVRGELEEAAAQIRERLGESDGASAPEDIGHQSVRDRLSRAIEKFEGKHPKLTEIVGRVVDALAESGV